MKNQNTIKILLAGEGGQGIQTIAKILSSVAAKKQEVSYIPSFGVEQRGTPSMAFVILSDSPIAYPRFDKADLAVILQKRAVPAIEKYISKDTTIIFDSSTIPAEAVEQLSKDISGIPATKLAFDNGVPKSSNVILLGKLSKILELSADDCWQILQNSLGEIAAKNQPAFVVGQNFELEKNNFSSPDYAPNLEKTSVENHGKKAIIIPDRCKSCGVCIAKCPAKALKFGQKLGIYGTPIPDIDLEKCTGCETCSRFCPEGGIKIQNNNNQINKNLCPKAIF